MTHRLTLNCLVLGQDRDHIFQVTLARTKSIADLKDAIKEKQKPAFDHVPAVTLVLRKVSIPVDSNLEGNVQSVTLVKPLSLPLEELKKCFTPKRGHLHVVVQPPPAPGE
jgi:hypothetical protein